ncbi:MAG: pilus assembly protein PilM [Verrucomicrobiota bacterium]|nr:pilus assembly protein PilM [Verrucomicrobiota bacterium]
MKVKKLSIFTGLDFGSDSIKVVSLKRGRETFSVIGYSVVRYNSGDVADTALLSGLLKKSLIQSGKYSKDLFITLSSKSPLIRYQQLSNMPADEMRIALKLNSSAYLNQDYSDYYIDCTPLPTPQQPDGKRQEKIKFLVAGAPKIEVDQLYAALKKVGVNPISFQVSAVSLLNAFEFARAEEFFKQPALLVDIGHSLSTISMLNKGVPELTRVLDFGGKNLTEAIASDLSCDIGTAEQQKISPNDQVKQVLAQNLNDLIREIRASINFFEGQSNDEIKKLFISGGSAKSETIRQSINEVVSIPVELWNPLTGIDIDLKGGAKDGITADETILGSALGAAVEGIYQQ